jgi:hypothetical protein
VTEIVHLYESFWTGFRKAQDGSLLPAFRQGTLPEGFFNGDGQAIVYPTPDLAVFTQSTANITYVYSRRVTEPYFLELIDDVLSQMKAAIPVGGKRLFLPDGSHIRLDFIRCETMRDFSDNTGRTMQGLLFFNVRSLTNL